MTVPYGHTGKTQHSTSILCKTLLISFFFKYYFDIIVAFLHVPWVQKKKKYDKLDYETLPVDLSFVLIACTKFQKLIIW